MEDWKRPRNLTDSRPTPFNFRLRSIRHIRFPVAGLCHRKGSRRRPNFKKAALRNRPRSRGAAATAAVWQTWTKPAATSAKRRSSTNCPNRRLLVVAAVTWRTSTRRIKYPRKRPKCPTRTVPKPWLRQYHPVYPVCRCITRRWRGGGTRQSVVHPIWTWRTTLVIITITIV